MPPLTCCSCRWHRERIARPALRLALRLGTPLLAFALLLTIDAVRFHGEYRTYAMEKVVKFARAISPSHWTGIGSGRDWGQPR